MKILIHQFYTYDFEYTVNWLNLIEIVEYPDSTQNVGDMAYFTINLNIPETTDLFWIKCVFSHPTDYECNFSKEVFVSYNEKGIQVAADLQHLGQATDWRVRINENSKDPMSPALFTHDFRYTVTWQ